MAGHGSYLKGGDADLAAMIEEDAGRWTLLPTLARYFEFPDYINAVPGPDEALQQLDREDGRLDGKWLGKSFVDDPKLLRRTPAYTEWQTGILEEMIRREGFGKDDTPDLLFTNYKQIDEAGHRDSLNSDVMERVVRASDHAVADLIDILNSEVGRGRGVMLLTADHGVIPRPEISGGYFIGKLDFIQDVEDAFQDGDDRPVIQQFRPTELWLDRAELRENGYSVAQVATFVASYTKGQNVPDPSKLTAAERAEPVFSAAFPGQVLLDLPCLPESMRARGTSD
jgi:hypothetical protein